MDGTLPEGDASQQLAVGSLQVQVSKIRFIFLNFVSYSKDCPLPTMN